MTPKLPFENEWGYAWAEGDEFRQVHGLDSEELRRPLIEDEAHGSIDRPSELEDAA